MDLLDIAIILLTAGYAISGYRRGVSWVGMSLAGLFVGILVGALAAPPIARLISGPSSAHAQIRAIAATGLFLFSVFTLQGVGAMMGMRLRLKVIRTKYVHIDSSGGAFLGLFGVLIAAWYVGLTFANSQFMFLDQQINNSGIVRALGSVAPSVPGPLAALDHVLTDPNNFSGVFAGLNGTSLPQVAIPTNVDTAATRAAAGDTYKVISTSQTCGGIESGSGWPISSNHIVTNAHVVAGGNSVQVEDPNGHQQDATVVYFDPQIDIAVLFLPSATFKPMTFAAADPTSGTTGVVIGYPFGGNEQVVPAAVRGTESAKGYDIYQDSNQVVRTIEVLAAHVVPGNSGGPIVDQTGTVVGVVFAASTTDDAQGYALAPSQVRGDITAGAKATQGVDTGRCTGG